MVGLGILRLLAVLAIGLAFSYLLYRLSRAVGLGLLTGGAAAVGLGYGALKADNPWSGAGLADNLLLMGVCALALAAYAGVSVAAARAIAGAFARRR